MKPEIKPCPFCGETPEYDDATWFDTDCITKWGFLECACGARGPDIRTGYENLPHWKDDAIKAWNKRSS